MLHCGPSPSVVFSDVLVDKVTEGIQNMWSSLKAAGHSPMTALGITTHSRTSGTPQGGAGKMGLVKMAARWRWQLGVMGKVLGSAGVEEAGAWMRIWSFFYISNGCTAAVFQLKTT